MSTPGCANICLDVERMRKTPCRRTWYQRLRTRLGGRTEAGFMWTWIFVAIAALVVVPYALGWLLPAEYSSSGSLDIPAPPDAVWRALNDYERHPMTGSARRRTESLDVGPTGPVWREDMGSSIVTVRTTAA